MSDKIIEELELQIPAEECEGHEPGPYGEQGVTVYCDGSCRNIASSRNHRARVIAQVRALLSRDWAVRVLDAWHDKFGMRIPAPEVWDKSKPGQEFSIVAAFPLDGLKRGTRFYGATPDTARLAAAEAVWPELPESVRAEIGERP